MQKGVFDMTINKNPFSERNFEDDFEDVGL